MLVSGNKTSIRLTSMINGSGINLMLGQKKKSLNILAKIFAVYFQSQSNKNKINWDS